MIINMNGAKAPETPSPVLQEKTVTPETLPTVIGADEGYDGLSQVTVNPDSQLKAENIRSGKTIFGVSGTFAGTPQIEYTGDLTAVTFGGYAANATTIYSGTKEPTKLDTSSEYIPGDIKLFNKVYITAKQGAGVSTYIEKYSTDYFDKRSSTDAYHVVFAERLPCGVTIPVDTTGMGPNSQVEATMTGNFKLYVYLEGTATSNMKYGLLLDIGQKTLTRTGYPYESGKTEANFIVNVSTDVSVDTIIPIGSLSGSIYVKAALIPDNVTTTTRRI